MEVKKAYRVENHGEQFSISFVEYTEEKELKRNLLAIRDTEYDAEFYARKMASRLGLFSDVRIEIRLSEAKEKESLIQSIKELTEAIKLIRNCKHLDFIKMHEATAILIAQRDTLKKRLIGIQIREL